MSASNEAVVTILHRRFFAEGGEGTRYLEENWKDGPDADLVRDIASHLALTLADEVVRVVMRLRTPTASAVLLERINDADDYEDGDLIALETALEREGLLTA